jgi:hypothetical protein
MRAINNSKVPKGVDLGKYMYVVTDGDRATCTCVCMRVPTAYRMA